MVARRAGFGKTEGNEVMAVTLWSTGLVFVGGPGASARFVLTQFVDARWNAVFPWRILLVNVRGSGIIGT